jgi:uncharacterized protein (DUF952 family)
MRETFHLVPAETWAAVQADLDAGLPYAAASLGSEGFIHCTDGEAALGVTFDRYYAGDPRAFRALTVDLDALDVPWRYDVADSPYPHIYGPMRRAAIRAEAHVERAADGRFAGLAPVGPAA